MGEFARKLLTPPPEGYFCMPIRIGIILGLCALLWSAITPAQTMTCRSSEVCLDWSKNVPTRNEDGTLIQPDQKPLKYRIYRYPEAFSTSPHVLVAETAGTAIKLVGEPRGSYCYVASTVDAKGAESTGRSAPHCQITRFPGPTEGAIDRPTDGGIESN